MLLLPTNPERRIFSINKHKPLVFFECANNAALFYGYDLNDIRLWFEKYNYCVCTINGINLNFENAGHIYRENICHDFVALPSVMNNIITEKLKGDI